MSKADSVAPLDQLSILRRAGGNSSREGTSNGTEINVQPGRQPEHKPDFLGSDQNQLEQPRKETSDSVMIGITSQHENARSRGNIQQDTTRLGNKDTQASVKVGGLNVVPDLPEHQAHNNAVEDDPWEGMSHISESEVTIPREQMDLLQHAHSWVPAEPGRRPPVANIPIGILTALNEKADRRAQWEEAEAKKTDNIALPELPTGSGPQSELASSDSETELPWSSSPVSPRRANQLPPDSSAEEPAQRTVSRSSKQRPPDSGVEGPSENDVQSDKKTPPGSRAEDSKIVQGLEANAQLPEDGRGKTSKLHKSNILRNSRSPNCAEQLENHSPPAKRRRVATPFESPRVLSTPHVARSPQKTEVESSKNPRNEENKRPKSPSSARSAPQADESRVADFIVGSGESKSDPPSGKPYESSIIRRHAAALPEVLQLRPTFIDMDRDFDSESSELETHLPEALGDDRESVHADHASSQISLSSIIQPRQNSLVQVERTPRAQLSKDTRAAAQVNTVRVSQEPGFLRKNTSDRRTRDASSDPMIQGTYSQGNPVNRSKLHQRLSAENNLDGSENHVEDRMVLCTAENQQEASPNGQGAVSQKSLRVSSVAKSLDMPAGEDAQKVTKRDDEELHQKRNSKKSLHPPAKLKKHRTGVKVSRSFQFSQDHRQYQDPRLLAKRHRQDFFTRQADPTSHRPELDPFGEKVDSHSLEGQTVAKKQHSHPTEAAHVTKETDHQPTGPGLDVERPASPSPEKSSLDEAVDGKLPEASLFVEREESQSLEAEKRTEGMGSEVNLDTGLSRVDEGDPAADLVSTESDARTPESSLHLTTKRLLNDKITGSHRDVHSNMTSPAPEELEVSSTPSSAISQEPRMNRQSPTLSEPYTYVSPQPMTIFESFKESYPDYTGTLDQFVGTCAYIEWLYQNDRMEHRALWDDFAVRHVLEFPDWCEDRARHGFPYKPYELYYRDHVEDPTYLKRLLSPQILMEALRLDPAAAGRMRYDTIPSLQAKIGSPPSHLSSRTRAASSFSSPLPFPQPERLSRVSPDGSRNLLRRSPGSSASPVPRKVAGRTVAQAAASPVVTNQTNASFLAAATSQPARQKKGAPTRSSHTEENPVLPKEAHIEADFEGTAPAPPASSRKYSAENGSKNKKTSRSIPGGTAPHSRFSSAKINDAHITPSARKRPLSSPSDKKTIRDSMSPTQTKREAPFQDMKAKPVTQQAAPRPSKKPRSSSGSENVHSTGGTATKRHASVTSRDTTTFSQHLTSRPPASASQDKRRPLPGDDSTSHSPFVHPKPRPSSTIDLTSSSPSSQQRPITPPPIRRGQSLKRSTPKPANASSNHQLIPRSPTPPVQGPWNLFHWVDPTPNSTRDSRRSHPKSQSELSVPAAASPELSQRSWWKDVNTPFKEFAREYCSLKEVRARKMRVKIDGKGVIWPERCKVDVLEWAL